MEEQTQTEEKPGRPVVLVIAPEDGEIAFRQGYRRALWDILFWVFVVALCAYIALSGEKQ